MVRPAKAGADANGRHQPAKRSGGPPTKTSSASISRASRSNSSASARPPTLPAAAAHRPPIKPIHSEDEEPGWLDEHQYWFECAGEYSEDCQTFHANGLFDCYAPDGKWHETGAFRANEEWFTADGFYSAGLEWVEVCPPPCDPSQLYQLWHCPPATADRPPGLRCTAERAGDDRRGVRESGPALGEALARSGRTGGRPGDNRDRCPAGAVAREADSAVRGAEGDARRLRLPVVMLPPTDRTNFCPPAGRSNRKPRSLCKHGRATGLLRPGDCGSGATGGGRCHLKYRPCSEAGWPGRMSGRSGPHGKSRWPRQPRPPLLPRLFRVSFSITALLEARNRAKLSARCSLFGCRRPGGARR